MKLLCKIFLFGMVSVALGCGGNDVAKANKDLKEISPSAPRPQVGAESGAKGGGGGKAEKPPSVVQ